MAKLLPYQMYSTESIIQHKFNSLTIVYFEYEIKPFNELSFSRWNEILMYET